MPEYSVGGQTFRRKNLYMPCAIGPRFERMTPEEQAEVLKQTWWADLIAASEWPALLREEGFSPSARSRLKKKAAGWLVALGRMAFLNPELFAETRQRAAKEYLEQVEDEHPFLPSLELLDELQRGWHAENGPPQDGESVGWRVAYGLLDEEEDE